MNNRKPSLITRFKQWYINNHKMFVTIQQNNEHFFLSRNLWKSIINDLPEGQRNNIRVMFKKYRTDNRMEYLMIINPVLEAEFDEKIVQELKDAIEDQRKFDDSIKDKPRSVKIIESVRRMNEDRNASMPFTAIIQFNMYGHIGFQGVQPSPAEIVYEYGLEYSIMKRFKHITELTDRIPIEVKPIEYNPDVYHGRKAYIITDHVLHTPTPTFAKPFEERKKEMARQRQAVQRARGIHYRNSQLNK